jgi:tRNA-dihydrouridine synthase A
VGEAAPLPVLDEAWRLQIEDQMVAYMARQQTLHGTPWAHIARHMLGLHNGQPGARRWRQVWSDHHHKALPPQRVAALATTARRGFAQPLTA